MTTATITKTNMTEFWVSVLNRCGGLASAKEIALMAIEMDSEEIQGLKEGATLRACQQSARQHLNQQDKDGRPASLRREVYRLDDDGQRVSMMVFIQTDMASQHDWEFTLSTRMDGMRGDGKKARKLADWGIIRWPETATRALEKIEREFGFSLNDVAGVDE